MNEVYLCLGGNLGNREANLKQALEQIANRAGRVLKVSSVYESAAWGKTGEPDYLNMVALLRTAMEAKVLMRNLLGIEKSLGRKRDAGQWASRTMDIDILFYNTICMEHEEVTIPHPRLHLRNFVLIPLAEIAPDFTHPFLGISIKQLQEICPDTSSVRRYYAAPDI